jgi:hypothetical protein
MTHDLDFALRRVCAKEAEAPHASRQPPASISFEIILMGGFTFNSFDIQAKINLTQIS